ncbi:MAG: hypothetical protein ACPGR7_01755 [Flavobacteriaceae bacterium]
MKKFLVLFILFVLPLGAYLFIIQGKINFEKLPVLTQNVLELDELDASGDVEFESKISVVAFIGEDLDRMQMGVLNLNEIVYKKLVKYKQFQIVAVLPNGMQEDVEKMTQDLNFMVGTDLQKWKFVFGSPEQIERLHNSFETNNNLDEDLSDNYVYIIDKEDGLRGRSEEQFGYNMFQAASLKNELLDDVKVVFYEYNSALKEFDNKREI